MEFNPSEIVDFYFSSLVNKAKAGEDVKIIYDRLVVGMHQKYQPVNVSLFDYSLMSFLHIVNVNAYKNNDVSRVTFDKILEELPLEIKA